MIGLNLSEFEREFWTDFFKWRKEHEQCHLCSEWFNEGELHRMTHRDGTQGFFCDGCKPMMPDLGWTDSGSTPDSPEYDGE